MIVVVEIIAIWLVQDTLARQGCQLLTILEMNKGLASDVTGCHLETVNGYSKQTAPYRKKYVRKSFSEDFVKFCLSLVREKFKSGSKKIGVTRDWRNDWNSYSTTTRNNSKKIRWLEMHCGPQKRNMCYTWNKIVHLVLIPESYLHAKFHQWIGVSYSTSNFSPEEERISSTA